MITLAHQKVIEKEQQTEKLVAMVQAQKRTEVSKINMEREVAEKRVAQIMQATSDEIHIAKQKSLADAELYKQAKLAEANSLKYTKEFMYHEALQALREQPKIFMGTSLIEMLNSVNDSIVGV